MDKIPIELSRYTVIDGEWTSDGGFKNSDEDTNYSIAVGKSSTLSYNTWAKFENITIPKGATIVSAKLYYTAYTWYQGDIEADTTIDTEIYFNKVANPTIPTSASEANNKTLTTNYGDWNFSTLLAADEIYESPDFKNAIQEIIDLNDWLSGNDLLLLHLIEDTSLTSNYIQFNSSITYPSTLHARLIIEYNDVAYFEGKSDIDISGTKYSASDLTGEATFSTISGMDFTGETTGYEIQRKVEDGEWSTLIRITDLEESSFDDSDIISETTYHYRVREYKINNTSVWSNIVTVYYGALEGEALLESNSNIYLDGIKEAEDDFDISLTSGIEIIGIKDNIVEIELLALLSIDSVALKSCSGESTFSSIPDIECFSYKNVLVELVINTVTSIEITTESGISDECELLVVSSMDFTGIKNSLPIITFNSISDLEIVTDKNILQVVEFIVTTNILAFSISQFPGVATLYELATIEVVGLKNLLKEVEVITITDLEILGRKEFIELIELLLHSNIDILGTKVLSELIELDLISSIDTFSESNKHSNVELSLRSDLEVTGVVVGVHEADFVLDSQIVIEGLKDVLNDINLISETSIEIGGVRETTNDIDLIVNSDIDTTGSVIRYEIQRKVDDGEWESLTTLHSDSTKTFDDDNNLIIDNIYYYRVRYYDSYNVSSWSNIIEIPFMLVGEYQASFDTLADIEITGIKEIDCDTVITSNVDIEIIGIKNAIRDLSFESVTSIVYYTTQQYPGEVTLLTTSSIVISDGIATKVREVELINEASISISPDVDKYPDFAIYEVFVKVGESLVKHDPYLVVLDGATKILRPSQIRIKKPS